MKINRNLLLWLQHQFNEREMSYAELGRRGKINYQNFQRILHAQVTDVTQETVDAICRAFGVSEAELLHIKKTGSLPDKNSVSVCENQSVYQSNDIYTSLANWLRTSAPPKVKAAVFSTAEIGGFRDTELRFVLSAQQTVSTQDDDCGEIRSA